MSKTLPALTAALAVMMLGTAAHADPALTRAQVRAETLAAMRDGTIVGRFGAPSRNVWPREYPRPPAVAHKTRAQVRAETLAAIRDGTIIGRFGAPARNVSPWAYPRPPAVAHKTRAQVRAELMQAMHSGRMTSWYG